MELERRSFTLTEIRVDDGSGKLTVRGHAAVFNSLSVPLWGFREKIEPGAFTKTLRRTPDVRALWNHDPNIVLGRTKASTLRLEEDDRGLAIEIDPPDWASSYVETIRRGDVDQMSFAFRVPTNGERWEGTLDDPIRVLSEIDIHDGDVSPVTYPAYPATNVSARSALELAGIRWEAISALLFRHQRGLPTTSADRELIQATLETLRRIIPGDDGQAPDVPEGQQDQLPELWQPQLLRRRLSLLERA